MTHVETIRLFPKDRAGLLAYMERFNAACDWLSAIAFREGLWHWLPLQRRTYPELRGKFQLSAAALVAIRKVASAYKNKSRCTTEARFHPRGAIPVYRHSYKREGTASLYGMRIPFAARRDVVLSGKKQAVLTYRHGKFILLQALESPSVPAAEMKDYLGCDLGVVNLLTDSEGQTFGGREVEEKRRIAAHRRARLQAKQSRAARRKLRWLAGKQARYQRDVNHQISKAVVSKALRHSCGIALEKLRGIRERITARRRQRARLANWAFGQLRLFLTYKAAPAGIPVQLVDPAHSSQTCPACGHRERGNRKNQREFCCRLCGHAGLADHIAARNIRARALGDAPNGLGPKVAAAMPATSSLASSE